MNNTTTDTRECRAASDDLAAAMLTDGDPSEPFDPDFNACILDAGHGGNHRDGFGNEWNADTGLL